MTKPLTIPTFMFHATKGQRLFKLDPEQYEDQLKELAEEGWKDTPKCMEFKKDEPEPDNGPVSLTAEQEALLAQFVQEPAKLSKDELLELGKALDVKLMKAWKEETLIKKIQEVL